MLTQSHQWNKNNLNKIKILNDYYDDHYADLCHLLRRRKLFHEGDQEDVVQEAFSRALQFIESYDPEKRIESWFLTILNNCYNDYYNAEQMRGASNEQFDENDFPTLDTRILQDNIAIEKVTQMISEKNEPMRTILNLYYIRNYPPKDIKKIIDGWAYNSIRTLIHNFGGEIKEKLKT